jgi:hypothetical protein
MRRTWFWMRSLTRSMGAAAVFETAAETPPTVDNGSAAAIGDHFRLGAFPCHYDANGNRNRWDPGVRMKRTQEVDHEALSSSLAQLT